ncbi:histone-like nucleoid-structuring protein Lsr2 [Streptomyces sp. MBT55]|uniref:DUF2637 domain-containing protein n=1 Tax=Streptomyces sp. MBT55 TaxID=1488386 RepID=UPI001912C685|nr:histone-like nucleoid-structuring protein Lsr2 [Streptomyces sp. MBT55]MBK6042011.1 DUF2637 domain-containing protein [Streptomyces sp. MBT55]
MSARNGPSGRKGTTVQRTDRAAASVVAGIAAGAFTLSYEALRNVYLGVGGNEDLSPIYPLIAEGFVTVAVWVAYRLRDHGWKATAYPWTLAALFFAYSLWANALPDTVPGPVILGVPSVAVPLAVHLFTHLLKKRESVRVELVELVDLKEDDGQGDEEVLSDEPWPAWEAPAIQPPIFASSNEKPSAFTLTTDSSARIRSWGRQNGYEVKDTGRIPETVLKAYARAHGGELVSA